MRERIEAEIFEHSRQSSFVWPASSPASHRFTPDQFREGLKRVSMIHIGVSINIQSYRHVAIAISRRYLQGKAAFQYDAEDEQREIDEDHDDIIDQQAGHSGHIAWSIYARGIGERDGEVMNVRDRFHHASQLWHRFLGFPSISTSSAAAPFEKEALAARMHRWRQLRQIPIETAL